MSSAKTIAYEIRPSKQVERRMVLDICQICRQAGYDLPSYRYIGFGGIKYIDFLLLHRYVGFSELVSVESDEEVIPRCRLNKPFSSMTLVEGEFSSYVRQKGSERPCVAWLDYDAALSSDIRDDLAECGTRLLDGSLLFVTVNAEPTGRDRKINARHRRQLFVDEYGAFASDIDSSSLEDGRFRYAVGLVLVRIMRNAFAARYPVSFLPLIQTLYKDTAWMCTVGGLVSNPDQEESVAAVTNVRQKIGALYPSEESDFFQVPQVNVTEIERGILDRAVTQRRRNSKERNRARRLGFSDEFMEMYEQIIRYVPRYVETAI